MNKLFALSVLVLFVFTHSVAGQRGRGKDSSLTSDIMLRVLQRSDANRDGTLTPSETSDRTKDFIRRSGLDPNRPHSLKSIADKAKGESDKQKKDSKRGVSGSSGGNDSSERKVPGFGLDVERLGVSDFSPSGEERMTVDAMKRKFGDSIMGQVERTMSRYDSDKNGLIDGTEQRRTRWTNPSATESDTNKDGNLSRLELAYRYKNREDAALKRSTSSSKRSSSLRNVSSKSTSKTSTFSNRRSNTASTSSRSYSSNRSSSRSTSRSTSKSKPFNSGSDAYKRYAEGLLKNYDKNKDGKLSKTELKEMRRPPEKADTNRDGFVDKDELIASVSKRSGAKSASNPNKSTSSSSRSKSANRGMERLRRDSKKKYNTDDNVFGGKDLNSDGQLQMSEFEDDWDEKKIAEFKEKDLNGDGVITAKEWKGG